MSEAANGVIQRKPALLNTQIVNLKEYVGDTAFEQFKDNWAMRSVSERTLQVCAEICIDIAERIIARKGTGPVATAAQAMETLERLGTIKSAEPHITIVRLRNLIAHQYEQVDPSILFDIVRNHLDDFYRFREEIDRAG